MAAAKRNKRQYRVEGTAVRKLDYMPEREYVPYDEPEKRPGYQPGRKARPGSRQKKKPGQERQQAPKLAKKSAAPAIDFFAMLVLVAAIGATFAVCISYLQVQAAIDSRNQATSRLESQTNELESKNDYTELKIQDSVDLEQIQQRAMDELGMVYPYNNQMITYEKKKSGYVRQYGELTGNEQESLIELLLRMLLSSKEGGDSAVLVEE
ncbi:MAG: hypothetical protein HFI40_09855 [Lachnospiraceae bacterium]|jgi:cell division protein FtsL|nr:hypothetical protein [Lachnospiraceae bacterium]MCX4317358.1 hypothetical protein [Lachnospiraceae bacterium]